MSRHIYGQSILELVVGTLAGLWISGREGWAKLR